MSKERARRREARERAAAARAERHAVIARRRGRRQALVEPLVAPFRRASLGRRTGRQTGVVAERRRNRTRLVFAVLLFGQVLVWIVRPDWQARLAAFLIALFAFPVIAAFTL